MNESCEYYEELMDRSLDGGLTGPEAQSLRAHMSACPRCRSLYDALSAVTLSLRDETAEPPPGFADSVMARVRTEGAAPARPRRVRLWPRIAAAASLAVVIGAGAYTALRGGMGGSTRTAATESAEFIAEAPMEQAQTDGSAAGESAFSAISGAAAMSEAAAADEDAAALDAAGNGAALNAPMADMGADRMAAAAEEAAEEPEPAPEAAQFMSDALMGTNAIPPAYTRDDPAEVPEGREAAFEALLRTARRSVPAGDLTVIAAVEYRGVIYEFLTDEQNQYLLWQDAAEGMPAVSEGSAGDLWDILYG